MLRSRIEQFALGVFLLGCLACVGCGGGDEQAGLFQGGNSSRAIALNGAEYLLTASAAVMQVDRASGLQVLGDIDKDGYPDLVAALNRKGAKTATERTWIEAYSGNNGKLLWSLQGKYDRDPKVGYRLGPIGVIADLNRDGFRDIYCCEAHNKRSAFLISGRTGDILGRYPIERRPYVILPIRCQDYNSDGTPDLLFSSNAKALEITVLSGKDLTELKSLQGLWAEAGSGNVSWVLPTYHDDNSDGVADCLVRRYVKTTYEYAVLDGKSFTVLRTFQSPRPRVGAKTFFAMVDDLNGDRIGDFVFSSGAGGGSDGHKTLLRAISGKDGAVVWDVSGGQIRGGVKIFSVDSDTGKKKSEGRDVGFGNAVTTAPDLNGDGVDDMAVLTDAGSPNGTRPAVLIVSGKTGDVISVLGAGSKRGMLRRGNQMIRLRPKSKPDTLTIAAPAHLANGEIVLAILNAKPHKTR